MQLFSSPASPFGRKVKIAAAVLGLADRIEIVPSDPNDPDDPLRAHNPLGKIPVLLLSGGRAIYDSRVIAEYLDGIGGGALIAREFEARIEQLALQALADGIMDAAILQIYEVRMRAPEMRGAEWVAHQAGKVERALAALEAAPPEGGPHHVGAIALACALGYLDLRFEGRWRAKHPRLAEWLENFSAKTPSFEATRMKA